VTAAAPAHAITIRVPAGAISQFASIGLGMVSALLLLFVVQLVGISQLQHTMSQATLYAQLRLSLAQGSTPVAAADRKERLTALGTPVAAMTFPTLGIQHEVVVEGSAPGQTMLGIAHRRDTVMPCQVGSSVLMARAGSYGGIGGSWKALKAGQTFSVVMGQGRCTYRVMDLREVHDKAPAAPTGRQGRLVLTTASGSPFMPTEVERIDARLITPAFDRSQSVLQQGSLPDSEAAMGVNTDQMTALVLLLEALAVVAAAGTWLWRRWGRWQAWIVVAPLALALGLLVCGNVTQLLPNLL
jgi:sortase A